MQPTVYLRTHWPLLTLSALILILAAFGEEARLSLRYQRDLVSTGDWWRLLTANLVHTNTVHALLNVTGLAFIYALFSRILSPLGHTTLLLLLMVSDVWALHLLTGLNWYVGISGALHGALIFYAAAELPLHKFSNVALLVIVSAKVIWEQLQGATGTVETLINAPVAVDSHFYGWLLGLALAAAWHVKTICSRSAVTKNAR